MALAIPHASRRRRFIEIAPVVQRPKAITSTLDGNMADLMPPAGLNDAAGRNATSSPRRMLSWHNSSFGGLK
jgi:hypothetical protein